MIQYLEYVNFITFDLKKERTSTTYYTMFRGFSDLNIKRKLICRVCKYIEVNVPNHHEKPMKWKLIGTFDKKEYFCCVECDYKINIPLHCNVSMFYSESEYNDTPEMTKKDYNNSNR